MKNQKLQHECEERVQKHLLKPPELDISGLSPGLVLFLELGVVNISGGLCGGGVGDQDGGVLIS